MATRRQRRIADLIHEELSNLLERKVDDPRLFNITLTAVEVSADLQIATVYYTVLDTGEEASKETQAGLDRAQGYLRRELAGTLSLRYTPQLVFRFDQSLAAGQRIEELLASLRVDE